MGVLGPHSASLDPPHGTANYHGEPGGPSDTRKRERPSKGSAPVERDRLFLISISPGGTTAERAKLPEVRKVNQGAILCSRKQGSAPAGNTIEKANRDERYASLLASMQNTQWSPACVKSAKLPEPSPDCDLQRLPNQGPGFYCYVERDSRSRSIAAN
jgi:hypothetical protein